MILPFLLALLVFGAMLPILSPLMRGSRPIASRGSFDQAVYRDQLNELDRDIARGLITPADAETARLEIQRRLLAADKLPAAPPRLSRSPILAAIVFLVIAAGSISSYLWLGDPGLPGDPYSARTAELARENGPASLRQSAATLAEKLKQNPSDAQGWLLYGRSLAMLGQWDQAEDAYRRAMALGQNDPDVVAAHAEVLVMQAGGTVTPAALAAFQQVLRAGPAGGTATGMARYYLAIADMQSGEPRRAIDGFQALLTEMPADSPMRGQIGERIADAARTAGIPTPELAKGTPPEPGPDASAAKTPDDQRQTMIQGMVASLAAKQEADPTNLDGWLRLGRAYAVLHQPDKAADAYDKAAKLRPDDVSIPLQEVRALLSGQPAAAKLSPRVIALLQRVQTADPDEPMVLWYLGLAAAQDGHKQQAREQWAKLLTKMPPGSEDAKMIQSALDALGKN